MSYPQPDIYIGLNPDLLEPSLLDPNYEIEEGEVVSSPKKKMKNPFNQYPKKKQKVKESEVKLARFLRVCKAHPQVLQGLCGGSATPSVAPAAARRQRCRPIHLALPLHAARCCSPLASRRCSSLVAAPHRAHSSSSWAVLHRLLFCSLSTAYALRALSRAPQPLTFCLCVRHPLRRFRPSHC